MCNIPNVGHPVAVAQQKARMNWAARVAEGQARFGPRFIGLRGDLILYHGRTRIPKAGGASALPAASQSEG